MSLKAQLMDDMKAAMKAKEDGKQKLAVIRMVRSAIRQTEIDGQKELDDNDIIALISKEVKMRKDSIDEFKKGGREDLVAQTEAEIAVLMPYLPEQLSEEEVRALVKQPRSLPLISNLPSFPSTLSQSGSASLQAFGAENILH